MSKKLVGTGSVVVGNLAEKAHTRAAVGFYVELAKDGLFAVGTWDLPGRPIVEGGFDTRMDAVNRSYVLQGLGANRPDSDYTSTRTGAKAKAEEKAKAKAEEKANRAKAKAEKLAHKAEEKAGAVVEEAKA